MGDHRFVLILKDRFDILVAASKVHGNLAQQTLDFPLRQLFDSFDDVTNPCFAAGNEWSGDHAALVAHKPDRQPLDF